MGHVKQEYNFSGDSKSRGQTTIQSASRAIQILFAVAESENGMHAKEVSEHFNLSLPTAYHLLNTLVMEDALAKDERRRYIIGPKLAIIADAYNKSVMVPEAQSKALNLLAEKTGETAYLSAWRGGQIVVLATVEGSEAVRVSGLTTGYSQNLHARASGKLLLAFADEEFRELALRELELSPLTEATIVDLDELREELHEIHRTRVSYDRQEFQEGVECVSMPIFQGDSVVACLTVSMPAERFPKKRDLVLGELEKITSAASRK